MKEKIIYIKGKVTPKRRTLHIFYLKIFVLDVDGFFVDWYTIPIIIKEHNRRIILGIWPESFYQAAVNSLTTM